MATGDPGVMPWVPLARLDGPPEPVLQECRRIIDTVPALQEHANLLAVSQVLGGLLYNPIMLRAIFGGREKMIESPILQELIAETTVEATQRAILTVLESAVRPYPP